MDVSFQYIFGVSKGFELNKALGVVSVKLVILGEKLENIFVQLTDRLLIANDI